MIITIGILTLFFSFCFLAIVKQNDEIKQLKSDIKAIHKNLDDSNVAVVRLMYHKALELEDYKTCENILKKMPKNFELHKF